MVRDGVELGILTEKETRELLRTGFLRETDVCWTEGTKGRKPLSEIEAESAGHPPAALLSKAKEKVSTTTGPPAGA